MKGFGIIRKENVEQVGTLTELMVLLRRDNLEILIQKLYTDASFWLEPPIDPDTIEFFYIIKGSITVYEDGKIQTLKTGDSFYAENITKNVNMTTSEETELLYIVNKSMFEEMYEFQEKLTVLMKQIDDRDHYTRRHCQRVRHYVSLMWEIYSRKNEILFSDLVIAAQFHDIGKCLIDDAVLRRYDDFQNEAEEEESKRHIEEGAILIGQMYNNDIAQMVYGHHERLDGTGFMKLKGDQITPAVRIISIADEFDKMTTHPLEDRRLSFLECAENIYNHPEKFDHELAEILLKLVKEDKINQQFNDTIESIQVVGI